ncbi:cutinase-like protein [Hapsidospora chrysogenum ATCC 11550]|uniref:Cutinase-like protein n=1 Tax=Hapsidospora chrysogenum (strain ATCC 11550 / CBS 779.69 / DSM 880 / IAM 14645 / JCM 23072 / IMI 49137) TaxID=857340 RepID=A0A086T269_HAPC1|nr:cutinase-like protein [Hapsidospora chrysogenum ATCC 11550]
MRLLLALPLILQLARAQECPQIPDNDVEMGEPVPMIPEHIPAGCSDYEVLVARGTSEPNYAEGGKFGVIVGDPVVSNLTEVLPGSRGYPVQYPASSSILSVFRGSRDVVDRLVSQSVRCPRQTFALVGYSQGAAVMHAAADDIPRALHSRIKAVVMFGDPALRLGDGSFPSGLQSKVLQNCAEGDPTCDSGRCTYYHLTYIRPEWIEPTVDFLVEKFTS